MRTVMTLVLMVAVGSLAPKGAPKAEVPIALNIEAGEVMPDVEPADASEESFEQMKLEAGAMQYALDSYVHAREVESILTQTLLRLMENAEKEGKDLVEDPMASRIVIALPGQHDVVVQNMEILGMHFKAILDEAENDYVPPEEILGKAFAPIERAH